MESSKVRASLLEIEEVVKGAAFEKWRRDFVDKHKGEFDYAAEESKLVYTTIHREYEEGLEREIAKGMGAGFDMTAFQKALPDYLESPAGQNDEASNSAVRLLLEAGDFEQFKEMMCFEKRKEEEAAESKSSGADDMIGLSANSNQLAGLDVEGMMDMCASLSEAADSVGWEEVLRNDWMAIHKMPVPADRRKSPKDIYLKGVWTMNLNMRESTDMMFTLNPRRKKWDSNFTSCTFPEGGKESDDDLVASAALSFGYVAAALLPFFLSHANTHTHCLTLSPGTGTHNLSPSLPSLPFLRYLVNSVMFGSGKGINLVTRNIRRWDFPTAGAVTYAMFPWNLEAKCIDANHKLLSLKTGTIAPHPTNKDKIVMTTLEINTMGGMPNWALHFMMRAVAPSMMKGLETRYIAACRKSGDVVDVRARSGGEGKEADEGKSNHK